MNLTVRPGWLRLTGQESMNSLHHVTLVARRQQEHEMQAETRMDFAPVCPEQMAGFTYCYDSMTSTCWARPAPRMVPRCWNC